MFNSIFEFVRFYKIVYLSIWYFFFVFLNILCYMNCYFYECILLCINVFILILVFNFSFYSVEFLVLFFVNYKKMF